MNSARNRPNAPRTPIAFSSTQGSSSKLDNVQVLLPPKRQQIKEVTKAPKEDHYVDTESEEKNQHQQEYEDFIRVGLHRGADPRQRDH